jgi:hypothetical protein
VAEGRECERELMRELGEDLVAASDRCEADCQRSVIRDRSRSRLPGSWPSPPAGLKLTVEHGGGALPELLQVFDGAGITPHSIILSRPAFEDVFLTGRPLRDDSPRE